MLKINGQILRYLVHMVCSEKLTVYRMLHCVVFKTLSGEPIYETVALQVSRKNWNLIIFMTIELDDKRNVSQVYSRGQWHFLESQNFAPERERERERERETERERQRERGETGRTLLMYVTFLVFWNATTINSMRRCSNNWQQQSRSHSGVKGLHPQGKVFCFKTGRFWPWRSIRR